MCLINSNVKFYLTTKDLTLKPYFSIFHTLILRYQIVNQTALSMNRTDLRLVEFSVTKKVKSKKSKKSTSKKIKAIGYFHIWGTNVDKKGNEKFFALIEDANTGNLVEIDSKYVRFLTDDQVETLYEMAEKVLLADELVETTEVAEAAAE